MSFETAEYTANADALGTLRLLEAMRMLRPEIGFDELVHGMIWEDLDEARKDEFVRNSGSQVPEFRE